MEKYRIATATSFSSIPEGPAHTIRSTEFSRDWVPQRCYVLVNLLFFYNSFVFNQYLFD